MSSDTKFIAYGDDSLVTSERRQRIADCMAADPRIATVSLFPSQPRGSQLVQATAPAGPLVCLSRECTELVGPLPAVQGDRAAVAAEVAAWAATASDRGLRHLWLLVEAEDVATATTLVDVSTADQSEACDPTSALWTTRADAGSAGPRRPLDLTVHAGWLRQNQTGAQVAITKAVEGLSRNDRVASVRVLVVENLPSYADHLVRLPKVEVESVSEMRGQPVPSDIVWYPNQPDGTFDIRKARLLGRRVVITFLDFIAYDIRSYHASEALWRSYRRRQRLVALAVDGVSAISADVERRVKEEMPLIDPRRVTTTALGVDHLTQQEHGSVRTYDSDIGPLVHRLCGRPFVLVLGNDFPHKNRDFAAKVWSEVVCSGYEGDLVLAGLQIDLGHARGAALSLPAVRGHSTRIEVLDHVRPRSREWLLSNADAVLYPSSAEGFGLVPYEAAAMGTPTVFTNFGPLAEVGRDPGGPQDWSVGPYVADLLSILTDQRAASRRVAHLRRAWDNYPWSSYADRLVSFFAEVQAMPPMDSPDWLYNSLTLSGPASVTTRLKRKVRDAQRLLGRRPNG